MATKYQYNLDIRFQLPQHLNDNAFILDAKCKATTEQEVVRAQEHLNKELQAQLAEANTTTDDLFDGKLGHNKAEEIQLYLEPGPTPVHSRPYSVPRSYKRSFQRKLQHLVSINVLRQTGPTEWGSSTFIIAKKHVRVRWINDLHELDKILKRTVYPLPLVDALLHVVLPGHKFIPKIDLTMLSFTFMLYAASTSLCTIVTPYDKLRYNPLAMFWDYNLLQT